MGRGCGGWVGSLEGQGPFMPQNAPARPSISMGCTVHAGSAASGGDDVIWRRGSMIAVLSARAGELPDPRLALGVIQQMRLALLCSDDAPCEDSEDGTGAILTAPMQAQSRAAIPSQPLGG